MTYTDPSGLLNDHVLVMQENKQYEYGYVASDTSKENMRLENVQDEIEHPVREHDDEKNYSDREKQKILKDSEAWDMYESLRAEQYKDFKGKIHSYAETVGVIYNYQGSTAKTWEGNYGYDYKACIEELAGDGPWRSYAGDEQNFTTYTRPLENMTGRQYSDWLMAMDSNGIPSFDEILGGSTSESALSPLMTLGDWFKLLPAHDAIKLLERVRL